MDDIPLSVARLLASLEDRLAVPVPVLVPSPRGREDAAAFPAPLLPPSAPEVRLVGAAPPRSPSLLPSPLLLCDKMRGRGLVLRPLPPFTPGIALTPFLPCPPRSLMRGSEPLDTDAPDSPEPDRPECPGLLLPGSGGEAELGFELDPEPELVLDAPGDFECDREGDLPPPRALEAAAGPAAVAATDFPTAVAWWTADACAPPRPLGGAGDLKRGFDDDNDGDGFSSMLLARARASAYGLPVLGGGAAAFFEGATVTTGTPSYPLPLVTGFALTTFSPTAALDVGAAAAAASAPAADPLLRLALPPCCVSTCVTSWTTSVRRSPHSGHTSCDPSENCPGTTAPAAVSRAPRALCSLRMLLWLRPPTDPGPGRLQDSWNLPSPETFSAPGWREGARTGPSYGCGRTAFGRILRPPGARPPAPPLLVVISRRYLLTFDLCARLRPKRRHAQQQAQHARTASAMDAPNFHVNMFAAAWSTRSSQSSGSGVVGRSLVLMNSPFAITAKDCESCSLSSSQLTFLFFFWFGVGQERSMGVVVCTRLLGSSSLEKNNRNEDGQGIGSSSDW